MADTKTIMLRKPIKYGKGDDEKTVTEITVREPLAGEYEAAEKSAGQYGLSIALIAILAGVPVDVIDDMYGSQISEAEDFIGSFGADLAFPGGRSPEEIDIELRKPVKQTAEDSALNISRISLVEPTNRQKRKANEVGGSFAASIALISSVGVVPKGAVRGMCSRDFLTCCGYFNGFQIRRSPDSDE